MPSLNRLHLPGSVKKGTLHIEGRPLWGRAIAKWGDCDVRITIEPTKQKRSIFQNSYYWGVVVDILSDEFGSTPDKTHQYLKDHFLPEEYVNVFGSKEAITTSTATLNTKEFSDYIEAIRDFAAEHGCYIPSPGEDRDGAAYEQ